MSGQMTRVTVPVTQMNGSESTFVENPVRRSFERDLALEIRRRHTCHTRYDSDRNDALVIETPKLDDATRTDRRMLSRLRRYAAPRAVRRDLST